MSIQWKGSVARFVAGAVTAAIVVATASCSESEGRESTDGNTSFLSPCETNENCPSTLECLCGVCSRACESDAECSSLPSASCVRPSVIGLECAFGGSLCGRSGREAGAGGSGGAIGGGGTSATGGRASGGGGGGGAGGVVAAGGASQAGGAVDAGNEPDASADGGTCASFDVVDAGSPCSIGVCTDGADWQIRVTREAGWYVGALWWTLVVCDDVFEPETYPGGDTRTAAFQVTAAEFAALDKNARVYVLYGGPSGNRATECGSLNDRLSLPQPIGECTD